MTADEQEHGPVPSDEQIRLYRWAEDQRCEVPWSLEGDEQMRLYRWARDLGFVVEPVAEIDLGRGRTRSGWLVYDLSIGLFEPEAVNWTTIAQVAEYVAERTGGDFYSG